MATILCQTQEGCRRLDGHAGPHNRFPNEAWGFFQDRDKNKLTKAGFATPRGGSKGAYQNHVLRSSRVIIPYERLESVDLDEFGGSFVIRLWPDQYFTTAGVPKPEFADGKIQVGVNAFVLYRSYASFEQLPPPEDWSVRGLMKNGHPVTKRGPGVVDTGEYILRLPTAGANRPERIEGPPQGIFAPEYADQDTNFLCQCVLAWLIIHTHGSPYTTAQASHLQAILDEAGLAAAEPYELRGALRHGLTSCPLCIRIVRHEQLHSLVNFEEGSGLVNAAIQVEGATRSTDVNLFHLTPLLYGGLNHVPESVAWGHANCNTRLGQRKCYSLTELQALDLKVGIVHEEGIDTFGWISADFQMIRSPDGAVWIQLSGDMTEAEKAGAPPPAAPDARADEEAEVPIETPEDSGEDATA